MDLEKNIEKVDIRLVPDDTIHKGTNPPLFETQVSLILDIAIASYSITHFLYYISIFYSTGENAAGDKPRGAAPTQRDGNVINDNPSRSAYNRL